jgi:hypothetical protein
MPFELSLQLILTISAGALAACIIEAASDRKLASRFVAHIVGALVVLWITHLRLTDRTWHEFGAFVYYLSGRSQLLFVWISALATAVVEEALGTNLFLCFILHHFGLLLALPFLSELPRTRLAS